MERMRYVLCVVVVFIVAAATATATALLVVIVDPNVLDCRATLEAQSSEKYERRTKRKMEMEHQHQRIFWISFNVHKCDPNDAEWKSQKYWFDVARNCSYLEQIIKKWNVFRTRDQWYRFCARSLCAIGVPSTLAQQFTCLLCFGIRSWPNNINVCCTSLPGWLCSFDGAAVVLCRFCLALSCLVWRNFMVLAYACGLWNHFVSCSNFWISACKWCIFRLLPSATRTQAGTTT